MKFTFWACIIIMDNQGTNIIMDNQGTNIIIMDNQGTNKEKMVPNMREGDSV